MFHQFIQKVFVLFFVLLTIFGFYAAARAQVCQPAADGLVSWYRADGSAADAMGANNGALRNGTTFAPGKLGQAFKFDGVDDFVEIADAASLKPQNLTLEAWVKFDNLSSPGIGNAPPGFQYIVFKKNGRQTDLFEGYSLIKLPDDRLVYSSSSNSGVQTTVVDNTQRVEVGKYYHVVGTYDGTTARLYVNGRRVGALAHNLPLDYGTRPVTIGGTNETNWDGRMNGSIDEVRIYNRALSDAEISANHASGLSLIANCDAEADRDAPGNETTDTDVFAWENETGEFTVIRYGATATFPSLNSPGPENRGAFFFAGGRAAVSSASQLIDLSTHAARIDAGVQNYNLRGYLGGFAGQGDNARLTATFLDAANTALGTASIGPVTAADRGGVSGLLARSASGFVPRGARRVEITLTLTRLEGTFNDGYADNLSFNLIQPAEVPANLAAWHGGDGDARDFTGAHDGALVFNPRFVVGKVGQAFRFQNGSHVQINSDGIFRGRAEGTVEAWIRPSALPNGEFDASAIWTESEASRNFTRLGLYHLRSGQVGVFADNSQISALSPGTVPLGAWTHVAGVYKAGEAARLYVNGALVSQSSGTSGALSSDLGAFVGIGALRSAHGDDFDFNGDIDEPSVYTRALSPSEIQSIYNAGTAGKIRKVVTNAGANVAVVVRDATVTFANVATTGETSQTPLETAALPPLPSGYAHTGLAYDIATAAAFSGDVDLCFNVPALAGANFQNLRLLQLENGNWVDRSVRVETPRVCGRTTTLSPFVIAENLAPTAASVTVGGRVTDASGAGVYRARITLTDARGTVRATQTNPFGYYRFTEVPTGEAYVLGASSKQHVFAPESMILNVTDELLNADFTAQESFRR